jgi:hypothetical protein
MRISLSSGSDAENVGAPTFKVLLEGYSNRCRALRELWGRRHSGDGWRGSAGRLTKKLWLSFSRLEDFSAQDEIKRRSGITAAVKFALRAQSWLGWKRPKGGLKPTLQRKAMSARRHLKFYLKVVRTADADLGIFRSCGFL